MTPVLTIVASKIVRSTVEGANDTLILDGAIIDKPRHSAATRHASYAATRDAARRCLQ